MTVPSTDGVTLTVHDLSPEASDGARALLLCHATGFHGRVWRAVADELSEQGVGRRCLAVDFRGYGDSTESPAGPDWHGFADDVLAVIDHFELRDVQGVGHSKGGAAMVLAELARPGTFERMVCFEPILFPSEGGPPGPNPLAEVTRRRRDTFDSFEAAIDNYRTKPTLGALRADVLEDYVRHGFAEQRDGSVRLKARREYEAMTYEMAREHDGFERLGEVTCPVLVCAGGDADGPAMIAPLVAAALPHGELREMPTLAHFGPLEDPIAFAGVVREYLDSDAAPQA